MSIDRLQHAEATAGQLAEIISRRSCAIVEGVWGRDEVERIHRALAPWLRGEKYGRNDFEGTRSERVYALLAKSPDFAALIEQPLVLGTLDRLLPEHYLLSAALAINVHPGETPQAMHLDDQAGGFLQPMPRDMLGVSTIWAFDDFTADNGSTEIVPGSHLWPAEREPGAEEIVQARMPAGSVLIFAGNCMHRGGANRSQGCRLGLTIQYCAPWMRQIESMLLSVPPEIAGQHSARIQELLGYSIVRPGFMGYVNGMHPKRLLDENYRPEQPAPPRGGAFFGIR